MLCSWSYQNQKQANWESKRDNLNRVWDISIHRETQIDVLEFANNYMILDSSHLKEKNAGFVNLKQHYLRDWGWQVLGYLKNARKMFKMDTTLSTPVERAEIDSLVIDGETFLYDYDRVSI